MSLIKYLQIISLMFIVAGPIIVLYTGSKYIKSKPRKHSPLASLAQYLIPKEDFKMNQNEKNEYTKSIINFYLNRAGWMMILIGIITNVFCIVIS